MSRVAQTLCMVVAAFLATEPAASAQAPASTFSELAGRIRVGQQLWVTDSTGKEVRGRLERLSTQELVVNAAGLATFAAADVRQVRARDRDPLKNGTLVGLGVGGALGTAWCIGAIADDSGELDARVECAEGFTIFPGLGALIGLAVDAIIPGRIRTVYQGPPPPGAARPALTIAPLASSRMKGLAATFAF